MECPFEAPRRPGLDEGGGSTGGTPTNVAYYVKLWRQGQAAVREVGEYKAAGDPPAVTVFMNT